MIARFVGGIMNNRRLEVPDKNPTFIDKCMKIEGRRERLPGEIVQHGDEVRVDQYQLTYPVVAGMVAIKLPIYVYKSTRYENA